MSELPEGWSQGSLGDVLRIRNGYAFKSIEFKLTGIPLVRQSNLDGDKVDLAKCVFLEEKYLSERADFTLHRGDVLIGMSGSVGKLCTYDQSFPALQNQRVGKIELHAPTQTDWRFVWHYLKTVTDALLNKAKGVAVANVSPDDIHSLPLDVPPLDEQTRIAQKLDELLAQVDTLKARIDAIPVLLKRFRQSVLAAAVSGRLTEDWRKHKHSHGSVELAGWRQAVFGEICREITVGYVGKMADQYKESGIPFLRSQNVRPLRFDPKNILYISNEFHATIIKSKLEPGDLAIVRSGAPGVTCVIPESLCVANCSDLVIARPSEELNSWFGCIYMNSEVAQRNVADNQVGVAQQHFNVGSMKKMPINLPPITEQTEIVGRVDQLFAFADQLEIKVASAKKRIDHLTQSILAKAFRGELVPQDPNDEPASDLLERIQAQRAAAPKAKRGGKASV